MKYNLTVAVIGTGFMGKQYAEILNGLVDRIILCTTDEKTGKELAEKYACSFYSDYVKMFETEKIDFAAICLPTHLHCPVSKVAMQYGVNVLCEKPFASSKAEAKEMVAMAEEKGLLLMIAHCLRFSKKYEYVRRCIADGRFGKLLSINSYRENGKPSWSVGNWLMNTALSGGVVRDLHVHDTDMIVGWVGVPESVHTAGSTSVCRTLYHYGNDLLVTASTSWRDVQGIPDNGGFDIVFEKGVIVAVGSSLTTYVDGESFEPLEREEFSEFFESDSYTNEIKYFCHCLVNHEETSLCPVRDSLKTVAVSSAESESLAKHSVEAVTL